MAGGAYYSFVRRTHEYGQGSDIELSNGMLSVGFAGANYGFLVAVPGVTIDALVADHPAVSELMSLIIPETEREVRAEQHRTFEGYTVDGLTYKRRVAARVGMAYVLRSINFGLSDVIVALQALREDEDGSYVFVWRRIAKNPTPTFRRSTE